MSIYDILFFTGCGMVFLAGAFGMSAGRSLVHLKGAPPPPDRRTALACVWILISILGLVLLAALMRGLYLIVSSWS